MGTRADLYLGRGETAEWLGSYPFDGHPDGMFGGLPTFLFDPGVLTRIGWLGMVNLVLRSRTSEPILASAGASWPWPWPDGRLTDWSYTWDDGQILATSFSRAWFRLDPDVENWGMGDREHYMDGPKVVVWPRMREARDAD